MIKIVLCMIVKNESYIIRRCLDSVRSIVDYYCITDTGSSDNTIDIIRDYFLEYDLMGQICEEPWQNFGYNRTNSYNNALKFIKGLSINRETFYCLFIDADMQIVILPEFDKQLLVMNEYLLDQKHVGGLVWANTRLVNMKYDWKSIGRTHEYWSPSLNNEGIPTDFEREKLKSIWINDVADGGCRQDKYARDIKLLLEDLKDDPKNVRSMFYLAETYCHDGQTAKAIEFYKKRFKAGGWDQECWYSLYKIMCMFIDLGIKDKALKYANKCLEVRPRAESAYKIAKFFREKSMNNIAYFYASGGLALGDIDDALFKDDVPYKWGLLEEISITAYYIGERVFHKGESACNQLLLARIPQHVRQKAHENLLFYVPALPHENNQLMTFDTPLLKKASADQFIGSRTGKYRSMSTSLASRYDHTNNQYLVNYYGIVRTVNYDQVNACYTMYDSKSYIRTKNILVKFDPNFKILEEKIIEKDKNMYCNYVQYKTNVRGYEDARLFQFTKSAMLDQSKSTNNTKLTWYFTASVRDTDIHGYLPLMCLCELDGYKIINTWLIELPDSRPNQACEKNWIPYVRDDNIYIIYGYEPFATYKLLFSEDKKQITLERDIAVVIGYNLDKLRGSACPIKFGDEFLMLVHEVVIRDGVRIYYHRFLLLNDSMIPKNISRAFYFSHKGIEYCIGLIYDQINDKLVLIMSYEDNKTYKYVMNLNQLNWLFSYNQKIVDKKSNIFEEN